VYECTCVCVALCHESNATDRSRPSEV
jgi:hypothetical protein